MLFRAAAESDLDRVLPLVAADPLGSMTVELFTARLGTREYRLDWMWIAEDSPGGTVRAVAAWWGNPASPVPRALDGLFTVDPDHDHATLAAELLAAALAEFAKAGVTTPPDFHLFLPADWHDRPDMIAAVAWRTEAARRIGLSASVERLRYEWTPAAGVPEPSARLLFRPEPDDEVFVDLFRQVLTGTLDAASGKEAAKVGAEAQARADVEFYRDHMIGLRSWWRVAETPSGEPVGFGLPSRNNDSPVVGYLGVLPEHRGHGYSDDILAEITRILAADASADRIEADTDLTNVPMAASFARIGYRNNGRHLVLSAD